MLQLLPLLLLAAVAAACELDPATGLLPPYGECDGPLDRALARRRGGGVGGCALGAVRTADGQCAECVPGRAGSWRHTGVPGASQPAFVSATSEGLREQLVAQPIPLCGRNQYCDDSGACVPLTASPAFGAACATADECGPGLQCAQRRCVVCSARGGARARATLLGISSVPVEQPVQPASCGTGAGLFAGAIPPRARRRVRRPLAAVSDGAWSAVAAVALLALVLGSAALSAAAVLASRGRRRQRRGGEATMCEPGMPT